jgi:hypothetical protein
MHKRFSQFPSGSLTQEQLHVVYALFEHASTYLSQKRKRRFHFSSLLTLVPAPSVSSYVASVATGKRNVMDLIPS